MILILKKRNAFLLALIFLLFVYIAGACVNSFAFSRRVSLPCDGKKIVLDAGHGEPDGGAVGKSGIKEQELNLKIAEKTKQLLEDCGMEVIMTRTNENGIYDYGKTIREKKRSDMTNREKLMNESDADLFLSIHMNKFSESKYSGPQVFYSLNNEMSKTLATFLQQELISVLKPESKREIKSTTNDIYLLKKAKLPAILIECGFLSNPAEEEKLRDENYQKEVAKAIYSGIIKYFSEQN